MEEKDKEVIRDMVRAILHVDSKADVFLFGSRARDDHHANSDWDLLILVDHPITPGFEDRMRNAIYEVELQSGQIITSMIEQKSSWEDLEHTSIYKNIQREGIRLGRKE